MDQIRKVSYSAIIQDSTLDISHTDQMSFICRYVIVEDKEIVQDWFLCFITEYGKTAYNIKKIILDRLDKEKLDFKKCRGIGFDNAASMAGVCSDVQRFLQNINRKAKFVSCSNHSLNLYGVHASAVNASAITFFRVIWETTFFSSFNHRCTVLSLHIKVMMKRLVTTRWSTCYEAIFKVQTKFQGVIQALDL